MRLKQTETVKEMLQWTVLPKWKHARFLSVELMTDNLVMNSSFPVFAKLLRWYTALLFPHCQVSIHHTARQIQKQSNTFQHYEHTKLNIQTNLYCPNLQAMLLHSCLPFTRLVSKLNTVHYKRNQIPSLFSHSQILHLSWSPTTN